MPGKYRTFVKDGKKYLKTRYNLLRLELLEKLSSIVSLLILVMIALVLVATIWVYISCIFIVLMERAFGSFIPAFLIMGGISLVILIAVILLKNQIILNPLVRHFSKIIFNNNDVNTDDEEEDDDDDEDDEREENYKYYGNEQL